MTCGLKPMEDRVVVLPNEKEETSPGGIVIPDNARKKSLRGKVLAVGPGKLREVDAQPQKPVVKVGDEVLYSQYIGQEVELPGTKEKVLVMRESEIMAVLESDEP
jgi:chaperonin GroES